MLVPKLLPTPLKIRILGTETAKIGPKSAFLVILGQILPFFAHFVQCSTNQQCEQGAWVGFLLSSPSRAGWITENPPTHLVHIVLWSGIGQNVKKMAIFGPK